MTGSSFHRSLSVCCLLGLAVAASGLQATDTVQYPAWSPDIHMGHQQGVVRDEDGAIDQSGSLGRVNFGGLDAAQDVDALHGMDNGEVLFSLETSRLLGGTLFRPNDVIRFDGSAWSMELQGSAAGIPDGVNIDAIAFSDGLMLLSVDIDTVLDGVFVSDSDIIAFNGEEFTVHLSAATAGIDAAADVDALHVDDEGRVLMSFETAGSIDGVHFQDEDLLAFTSGGTSLAFDGSADDLAWIPADLDAWSSVTVLSLIFRDGFELLP